jgi:hypothetical protein
MIIAKVSAFRLNSAAAQVHAFCPSERAWMVSHDADAKGEQESAEQEYKKRAM